MTCKVLIFGKNGQVGSQLVAQFKALDDYLIIATDIEDVDLTDSDATRNLVLQHRPQWVINTSAHTAVDRAESEQSLAHQLNAIAPGVIAGSCKEIGAKMVHYSTDYVFDGQSDRPYVESDQPNPQSVYGHTKLDGERAVLAQLDNAIILRTAWVYSKSGKNFVNTMLKLAQERDQLNVVADQFGSPTLADDLAAATIAIIQQFQSSNCFGEDNTGIFHATGQGTTNWSGFSEAIMQLSGNGHVKINPIGTAEYPTPAPRPAYSVLSNEKLKRAFGLVLSDWQEALKRCLS